MLDSQDPEVLFDLCDINHGKPSWTQVEAFINEKPLEAVVKDTVRL